MRFLTLLSPFFAATSFHLLLLPPSLPSSSSSSSFSLFRFVMHSSSIRFIIFSFVRLKQSISRGMLLLNGLSSSRNCAKRRRRRVFLAPAGYFLHPIPTSFYSSFLFPHATRFFRISSSFALFFAPAFPPRPFLFLFFFTLLCLPICRGVYKDPKSRSVALQRVARRRSCFQSSRVSL